MEGSDEPPRFVDVGVETDLRMDEVVEMSDHLAEVHGIDEEYILREQHQPEIEARERDFWRVHHHRTQHPHVLHGRWPMLACKLCLSSKACCDPYPPEGVLHSMLS